MQKIHTQQLPDRTEVHSRASLLERLGSLNHTLILPHGARAEANLTPPARLTLLQERAFSIVGLIPARIP